MAGMTQGDDDFGDWEKYSLPGEGQGCGGVAEAQGNAVREKSFAFSLAVIRLYKRLQNAREFVVSNQLLRSGTSVGANIEEATAAASRRDFLHKCTLASKEARESMYWLRLLAESDLVPDVDVTAELEQAHELVRILTAIVKSLSTDSKDQ
jgi:four helix bundle protein